jgi:hypothetical protein
VQKAIRLRYVFFLLFPAICLTPVYLAAQSKEVVEGARKEGQLVFYSGMPIPDAQTILSAIEKKYPFITTTFYRATGRHWCREFRPNSAPVRLYGTS